MAHVQPRRISGGGGRGPGLPGLWPRWRFHSAGLSIALIGTRAPDDHRTTALLTSSVSALTTLGVWDLCRDQAAALRILRIVDDTARLWRAPETRFDCAEIGLDAFAQNIENRHLVAALESKAAATPHLQRFPESRGCGAPLRRLTSKSNSQTERYLRTQLAVGADGRNSICREAARIEMRCTSYPQVALTYNVSHSRPHRDIVDGVSYRARPLHHRAVAGRSFEHRVRGRCARGRARPQPVGRSCLDLELERRSRIRSSAKLRSSRAAGVSAAGPRQRSFSPATALHLSARPRIASRRLAHKGSIWACATPPLSPRSRANIAAIPARPQAMRATRPCAAPM